MDGVSDDPPDVLIYIYEVYHGGCVIHETFKFGKNSRRGDSRKPETRPARMVPGEMWGGRGVIGVTMKI